MTDTIHPQARSGTVSATGRAVDKPLKLHEAKHTPSCRRVGIYLAEKGLNIERVPVDISRRDHKTPGFLTMNPIGKVPILQVGDDVFIPESAAIVEYLEERYPEPSMLGSVLEDRAQVRASERMASEVFTRMAFILLHTHPSIPSTRPDVTQFPDTAKALRPSMDALLAQLESRLAGRAFLAGDSPTVADCTLFAVMEVGYRRFDYEIPARLPGLRAWYEAFSQRPSARL